MVEDIKERGEDLIKQGKQPSWSDMVLLKNIDPKELGNAISASNYSISLVKEYLENYKFKNWLLHSDGQTPVTPKEKIIRAEEIAKLMCDHSKWLSHGHSITREAAWNVCKLKITHSEVIQGLDRVLRRMWALVYWMFENTLITKIFISENYALFRNGKQNN